MNNTAYIKVILGFVMLDIGVTYYCVTMLGAIELNPLAANFQTFMIYKCILSVICFIVMYRLRKETTIKPFLMFLVGFYACVTFWNIVQYVRWCVQ